MIWSAPARLSMVNSSASSRQSRPPDASRVYSPETEQREVHDRAAVDVDRVDPDHAHPRGPLSQRERQSLADPGAAWRVHVLDVDREGAAIEPDGRGSS
jgi:hypothetical protein